MSESRVETVVREPALVADQDDLRLKRPTRTPEREPDSSSDSIKPLPMEFKPRKRPGRTDGITPRFESMLEEAQRTGYENGYRAAFQALGLDARAVRVGNGRDAVLIDGIARVVRPGGAVP